VAASPGSAAVSTGSATAVSAAARAGGGRHPAQRGWRTGLGAQAFVPVGVEGRHCRWQAVDRCGDVSGVGGEADQRGQVAQRREPGRGRHRLPADAGAGAERDRQHLPLGVGQRLSDGDRG